MTKFVDDPEWQLSNLAAGKLPFATGAPAIDVVPEYRLLKGRTANLESNRLRLGKSKPLSRRLDRGLRHQSKEISVKTGKKIIGFSLPRLHV